MHAIVLIGACMVLNNDIYTILERVNFGLIACMTEMKSIYVLYNYVICRDGCMYRLHLILYQPYSGLVDPLLGG